MAGTFQLSVQLCHGDREAVVAAGLLHGLMDFQHYNSHGLTQVRVRLSGQQHFLALHLSLVWVGFGGHCCCTGLLALWR